MQVYSDELYHHGILGMKWGVRRYQNYDGSYTQAGMKRYRDSMAAYEKANARYKSAKKNGSSETELVNARLARKQAKRKLNKDYKHLKQDKLADQGKALYAKGHTITGDSTVSETLATIGSFSIGAAKYAYDRDMVDKSTAEALAAVAGVSLAVAGAKKVYDWDNARKLRAYYSHTSNY